jgi:hypothetical protein
MLHLVDCSTWQPNMGPNSNETSKGKKGHKGQKSSKRKIAGQDITQKTQNTQGKHAVFPLNLFTNIFATKYVIRTRFENLLCYLNSL